MDISCRLAVAFALFFAFCPMPALGQGLSGSLSGSVKDEQGGTLAGATVTVSSPSQIGGAQRAIVNEKGQWRFPVLAPGVYVLVVELAAGFAAYREEGISIGAGASIDRPVVPQAGRCCPVDKRRGGLERRVTLERPRDPVRPRLPRDYPHAALQHVRRDPERAGHVADLAVEWHQQHGVLVRIRRERERVHDRRHHLHLSLRRRLTGRAER